MRKSEPPAVGMCYCGCGEKPKGKDSRFAGGGHDAKARKYMSHLHGDSTAGTIVERGYGPDGDNLKEKHDRVCTICN